MPEQKEIKRPIKKTKQQKQADKEDKEDNKQIESDFCTSTNVSKMVRLKSKISDDDYQIKKYQ